MVLQVFYMVCWKYLDLFYCQELTIVIYNAQFFVVTLKYIGVYFFPQLVLYLMWDILSLDDVC